MRTQNSQPEELKSNLPEFDLASCRGHLEGDDYEKRRIEVAKMLQWFHMQGKKDIELHYYFVRLTELNTIAQTCEVMVILKEKGFLKTEG